MNRYTLIFERVSWNRMDSYNELLEKLQARSCTPPTGFTVFSCCVGGKNCTVCMQIMHAHMHESANLIMFEIILWPTSALKRCTVCLFGCIVHKCFPSFVFLPKQQTRRAGFQNRNSTKNLLQTKRFWNAPSVIWNRAKNGTNLVWDVTTQTCTQCALGVSVCCHHKCHHIHQD